MFCRNICVENFRNIESANVEFCPGTNVLIGENAQGKTNLLEAIYMTALGKSFRQGSDKDVIRFGQEYCSIKNGYTDDTRDMEISMRIFSDRRAKRVEQNGLKVARTSDMVGSFKVVLFCPEHLSIIKEGPAIRRNFLDVAISQIRPLYMKSLQRYATILKERNALIKDSEENRSAFESTVDLFSEQLAQEAAIITVYRVRYVQKLKKHVAKCFSEMTGERELPELEYISSCDRIQPLYFLKQFHLHQRSLLNTCLRFEYILLYRLQSLLPEQLPYPSQRRCKYIQRCFPLRALLLNSWVFYPFLKPLHIIPCRHNQRR